MTTTTLDAKKKMYITTPVSMFGLLLYKKLRVLVQERYPDYDHSFTADLYTSASHWLATYQTIMSRHDAMVFFADNYSIGKGVYNEIEYMLAHHKPVVFFDHVTGLTHEGITLNATGPVQFYVDEDNWTFYAAIIVQ